ncbi:hypothetical protein LPJ53_003195 [Coemansia erecta]|uniref:DNA repair protein Rev1 C-terminal domain-containing protein n=1 Tax=Coemansia erecta TaxID=147472 RepID=A0A9W7XWR2_9FUNG|nr:hypothetical protein LPJ53_003195 [Coemansia erecta]
MMQQMQRRLTDAFRRVAQLDSVVPSQADAAVWAGLPASVRRELARDYMRDKPPGASSDEGGEPDEPDGSDESGEPVAAAAAEEPGGDVGEPALCGARGSRDVCGLVGRWVAQAGGSAPLDEDVDALAEFLEALVRARCVARANEVLGHLRRCVACCAPESCAWRRTVAAVLARVNAVCSAMYDASLDV